MSVIQRSKHCKTCKQKTLHQINKFSGGMGLLLTLLSGGLFLLLWLPIMFMESLKPYRCQLCGKGRHI